MTIELQTAVKSKLSFTLPDTASEWSELYNTAPPALTDVYSPRSSGSRHEYFSEGDYWWPEADMPGSVYVRRDGMSNPDNFIEHRKLMIKMSNLVSGLTLAWMKSRDRRYAAKAVDALHRWFIDENTRMLPHLRYSQAINGICMGRSIGIIDTIHLIEAALSARILIHHGLVPGSVETGLRNWFKEYLRWLQDHDFGKQERAQQNNHGTCWYLQTAAFAKLVEDDDLLAMCRKDFKSILLPGQMAADGSFPNELVRTKPYGYSLFNLDAMTALCQLASVPGDDLFAYETGDGRGIARGIEFLYPYVKDKALWPYGKDIAYWDNWPAKQSFLFFGDVAYNEPEYLDLWESLTTNRKCFEVLRNLPVKNPAVWL